MHGHRLTKNFVGTFYALGLPFLLRKKRRSRLARSAPLLAIFESHKKRDYSRRAMDPTIVKGNVFSCGGAQNHILCNTWKDQVKKEINISKRWKASFDRSITAAKSSLREPTVWAKTEEAVQHEMTASQQRGSRMPSPRTVLLPQLRDAARSPENRLHFSQYRPASRDIGGLASNRHNKVVALDRLSTPNVFGHKPILQSSFFRVRGVFS